VNTSLDVAGVAEIMRLGIMIKHTETIAKNHLFILSPSLRIRGKDLRITNLITTVAEMDNKLFKALSSKTRLDILRKIMDKEYHLSELSREMGISKPVISRHVKILEDANLIKRKKIGNVHVLKANMDALEKAFEPFVEEKRIKIKEGKTVFDILKQLPEIEVKEHDGDRFITAVDGEEGLYIYEIDGEIPDRAINRYKLERSALLQLKKLVPITKKRIRVEIEKD